MKLFGLCILHMPKGHGVVAGSAGYMQAVSEEEAIGKGIKLARERFPESYGHQVSVIEIPMDTLREVINGSRHLKSVP